MMTLEEIEALPGEFLTCKQIAGVIGSNPQTIHMQAMECPEKLGFRVVVAKSRVKIPKRAFIRYFKGDRQI